MDYEHTLTAADVKIRTTNVAWIGEALGAGWPGTPFIAEENDFLDADGQRRRIATLATGRTVSSSAEITMGDVDHYLTDVVGLRGGRQVRLGGADGEGAVVLFTDAAVAQRILEAHLATTYDGPGIDLVVTRRHPAGADVAFAAFDLWLHGEAPDYDWGGTPDYDPSDADCEPGCSDCTDDSVPDVVNGPDDDDEDPYDYPCEGCGAQPGQDCLPSCEPAQNDWSAPARPLPPL